MSGAGPIRALGIHKRYRHGPPVLSGVDLTLEPGVPVVLAGANGSGKSTLLRILAGCARPNAGRVDGRPRVVGYLPDRFPALLRMPADVYLRHLAAIRRVPVDTGLLETLGFTGPRREPMARLSKGNAQKVGLAQALGCGAGLVVLDEPWAGLDSDAADTLFALLSGLDAPLLVTDHTGRAARIPGARHLCLDNGALGVPEAGERVVRSVGVSESAVRSPGAGGSEQTAPIPVGPVAVVLRCAEPEVLRGLLGVPGRVGEGRLFLQVPAPDVDALLLAALRRGASVETVGAG